MTAALDVGRDAVLDAGRETSREVANARPRGDHPLDDLDAALAVAARGHGLTFVALPAPVVESAAIVEAFPELPLVAWSSPTDRLVLVGVGVAAELRGQGPERFAQIAAAARAIRVEGVVLAGAPSNRTERLGALGFARPRFLGGAAFAPGTANASPWTGFGDAWFVLPRWTYAHDGATAWLVLAVDAAAAREAGRWHRELAVFRQRFVAGSPPHANSSPGRAPENATPATTGSLADSTSAARLAATDTAARPSSRAGIETASDASDLYRAQVEAITSTIANGDCSKIVAARSCAITLDERASAAGVLASLDARHPECYRVVVRPPGGGTLVAATPERLVRLDGDGIHCDALAGTVRLDSPDAEAGLLASDKDRREHAIVVDAIRDALTEAGATVDAPTSPAIKRLRHVLHLHTPICATVPRDPGSLHVLELAARLHPTPAVGGTPTAFAVDWIRDHEPVPRGWYASPVGWFDLDGDGELAVAIRSGVLTGDRAHLWAGAGIVAGSDPDRELAETELKLRAMLGALRGTGGDR